MPNKKYKSYGMYWSGSLENSKICPECGAALKKEYQTYLISVKIGKEQDSCITGDPDAGYFCPKCPVVVLDDNVFENMLNVFMAEYYPNARSFKFAVGGVIDYDAIPEDKRDDELGTDGNPIPLISFKTQSKKKTDNNTSSTKPGKIGRNEQCPCGSGKKYKKCCGRQF